MRVFITGGCGYVGSRLIPDMLIGDKHEVVVMDLQWFGNSLPEHDNLQVVKEDICNEKAVRHYIQGCDAVIHLACISNDVSLELNPTLGKSINFDCFPHIVNAAKEAGVQRFIYASSSSVYGIKTEDKVTEDLPLEPMTDYARFKAECEPILFDRAGEMCATIIRPGAVCGYAPRLRLDLVVNMLTAQAYFNNKITVLGGEQLRAHLHLYDMISVYQKLLEVPEEKINRQIFNVSGINMSVLDLAKLIVLIAKKENIECDIEINPTEDRRSYHICSDKIADAIGFKTIWKIEQAISLLFTKFKLGKIPEDPFGSRYVNIKRMKELEDERIAIQTV